MTTQDTVSQLASTLLTDAAPGEHPVTIQVLTQDVLAACSWSWCCFPSSCHLHPLSLCCPVRRAVLDPGPSLPSVVRYYGRACHRNSLRHPGRAVRCEPGPRWRRGQPRGAVDVQPPCMGQRYLGASGWCHQCDSRRPRRGDACECHQHPVCHGGWGCSR
jgi:hypothetical protein